MTTPIASPAQTSGGVSVDTSRLASADNLQKAGERFEAIFTNMMLSSMRKAKLTDGLFESQALDQFRDMQDQQLAQAMAETAPIGIGKAMTDFLAKQVQPTAVSGANANGTGAGPDT